jgi:UDP-N-acetylglucosamine 3-dehydrogenase
MTIKIGIIGAGSIVRHRHLPETQENEYAEVGAVCDVVEERAKEMAAKYNCKAYTDYKDLIADKDLDAVIVAATNTTHAEMTIAALEAGKHVLCEKPMATNLQDAQKMIDAAEKTGMKLMIAQNQRLEAANQKAKEIIQSGKLGKVLTFRSVFGHPGCEYWAIDGESTWFFKKSITAMGCLGDLAIHKLDLLHWILEDDYVELCAFADTLSKTYPDGELIDVEDNATVILRTKKGATGTVIVSWTYQKEDNSSTFYCENGVLHLYADPEYDIIIDYDHERAEYHKTGKKSTNVEQVKSGIIDAFVDCIVNDTEPLIPGIEGYKALETVVACLESSSSGKVVRIG